MSGILVATPSSSSGPSPRNPPSPGNALSPNHERAAMTATVHESVKINRAHLFVQKDHQALLRGMNLQEQWYAGRHSPLTETANLRIVSLLIGCINFGNIPSQQPGTGAEDHASGIH
jgi:hypothetical protein